MKAVGLSSWLMDAAESATGADGPPPQMYTCPSQNLMKELITDLATHYNLSEKQVQVMSESLVFDSFSKTEMEAHMAELLKTPAGQPVLEVEELSLLLQRPQEATPRIEELRSQVRAANVRLATPPSTPGTRSSLTGSDFVGSEAGRLEVERARMEVELAAARQRIVELELGGRRSLGRDDVMSGVGEGEGGEPSLVGSLGSLGEVRERAARLLGAEGEGEVGQVLGELLLQVAKPSKLLPSSFFWTPCSLPHSSRCRRTLWPLEPGRRWRRWRGSWRWRTGT